MSLKPSRAAAEAHAPTDVAADTPSQALWRKLDFFPTPPWAARAIAYRLHDMGFGRATTVLDPCCGEGHFAGPLKEYFDTVHASDVYNYGYGDVGDYLDTKFCDDARPDLIVTNPPFRHINKMLPKMMRDARLGVCVLCRLNLLETGGRELIVYGDYYMQLTSMWPFVERVPMVLGRWDPAASTATAYAAFLFTNFSRSDRMNNWCLGTMPIRPFGTGTKKRFWRNTDVTLYGGAL